MWSAAILAGGNARRFDGRDKGALIVDRSSILDRQIAALSQVTDDILIVAANNRGVPASARLVRDRVPGCGPLAGVHAALLEAHGAATIVVACDMPYISARLAEHMLQLTDEAALVVPYAGGRHHPLYAAYTRACLEPIARRLAEGRLKMLDLFEDVHVRTVDTTELVRFGDPRRLLANVNTPAEHRDLDQLQGHQL